MSVLCSAFWGGVCEFWDFDCSVRVTRSHARYLRPLLHLKTADNVLIRFNFSYLWLITRALFHFLFFFSISYTFADFWVTYFWMMSFLERVVAVYWTWMNDFLGEDIYVFFFLLSKRIKGAPLQVHKINWQPTFPFLFMCNKTECIP